MQQKVKLVKVTKLVRGDVISRNGGSWTAIVDGFTTEGDRVILRRSQGVDRLYLDSITAVINR